MISFVFSAFKLFPYFMPMRMLSRENTILLIVDVQQKLMPYIENNKKVIKNITKLAKFAGIMNIPVIISEQKNLGSILPEIKSLVPNAIHVEKEEFSCFDNKDFVKSLGKLKKTDILIAGVETHICVMQTALQAMKKYSIQIVSDATSSRKSGDAAIAILRMKTERITITTTETAMFEVMKKSSIKEFKDVLEIVKA